MRQHCFRRFVKNLGVRFTGWIVFFLFCGCCSSLAQNSQMLSPQDLIEVRSIILSGNVPYENRIKLAETVVCLLEKMNRGNDARKLCLLFYESVLPFLENENSPQTDLQSPFSNYIKAIDQGKRKTTLQEYQNDVQKSGKKKPESCLSLIALKADDMPMAYLALLSDFEDKKLSVFSNYVLAILIAREKRFVEAERLLEQAKDNLKVTGMDKWLAIDLIKLDLVLKNFNKAETLVKEWLEKDPNDPNFINLIIFCLLEQDKKDIARQKLAQVIPLLYEDPYLIAETANLAMQLNELDKGVEILQKFEPKVEPNRDFYSAYYLILKAQGKLAESETYAKKASQIQDARVAVTKNNITNIPIEQLRKAIEEQRLTRKKEIENLDVADALDKVYLFLLSKDSVSAIEELKKIAVQPMNQANTEFVLASVYKRIEDYTNAIAVLELLKKDHPKFRPYTVLTLLADLYCRNNDFSKAQEYYRELDRTYPDSYQAAVARTFLKREKQDKNPVILPVKVSTLISRYDQYGAPFIISEVLNYWGERIKFSSVSTLLGTSPRRALAFDEFLAALIQGTPYKILPFIGDSTVMQEILEQKIPIVYSSGEMFSSQRISELSLITGMDPTRKLFYGEGVASTDQSLFSETELLEGICFAVYPNSVQINFSEKMKIAIQQGKRFMDLNRSSMMALRNQNYDLTDFKTRKTAMETDADPLLLSQKLGFIRWEIQNSPLETAKTYIEHLRESCNLSSQYWFLSADVEFQVTKSEQALKTLDTALMKKPDELRYELARVRVLNKVGKTNEAIVTAEYLREQYPENSSVSAHLVGFYQKVGAEQLKNDEETRLKNLLHIKSINIDFDDGTQKEKTKEPKKEVPKK